MSIRNIPSGIKKNGRYTQQGTYIIISLTKIWVFFQGGRGDNCKVTCYFKEFC